MVDVSLIKEHLEVVVRTAVTSVASTTCWATRSNWPSWIWAGGFKHHLIPVSWVARVDDKHVHLNLTQEDAKARWSEKPH